jgi:hypothetical protein
VAGHPLFVVSKGCRVFRSEDFHLAIHHGTQKRTVLSIESWIVDGGKNCYGLLVCDLGMFLPELNQNERFSV